MREQAIQRSGWWRERTERRAIPPGAGCGGGVRSGSRGDPKTFELQMSLARSDPESGMRAAGNAKLFRHGTGFRIVVWRAITLLAHRDPDQRRGHLA